MGRRILYREAENKDVKSISEMVLNVFNKFVGPGYSQEGKSIFHRFVKPDIIHERLKAGSSFILIAEDHEEIIGAIEVRNGNHISLLFVSDLYHKLGVAKQLIAMAIEKASINNPLLEITVNSSPYAVDIYKKLGFSQLDKELEKDGIRYIPMKKCLCT